MENQLYSYSPIVSRPKLEWPNAARVAFYVGLNIEHYLLDRPSTSIFPGTATLVPDPLNYGWRDYGPRVGIWRLIETLDRYCVRASVLLNADVCTHYPQIIAAGRARDWVWLAHGKNNSILQTGMDEHEERGYLTTMTDTIAAATGTRPRGWLGPALSETLNTPRLLQELGFSYVLDWCNDDQPYPLNLPGMLSVPYSIEINDITLFMGKSLSGSDFYQIVVDQFDQLNQDGEHQGRVMALCLHPFIIGQPFRHKYLEQALAYISSHDGVWLTTSDDIAAHCAAQAGDVEMANETLA